MDELLQTDSRARQLWWEFVDVEAGIMASLSDVAPLVDLPAAMAQEGRESFSAASDEAATEDVEGEKDSRPLWRAVGRFVRQYPVIACSVAAVVVAGIVGLLALAPPPGLWQRPAGGGEADPVFVARLVNTHQATFAVGQLGSLPGAYLQAGHRYELTAGFAEIQFHRGASVILEGPADFVITGDNDGRLAYGKLAAHAPPSARGFQIGTRDGRVVDLGTAFGIDAPPDGPLAIHCFRGSISFEPNGQPPIQLIAGEAIANSGAEQELEHEPADITRFVADLRLHVGPRTGEWGMIVDSRFTNNVALDKPAVQSTTYSPNYPAAHATDGDARTFTHTSAADKTPSLTIDLGQSYDIDAVFIHNRDECCGQRLQDIFVELLADDGKTVNFASKNLNPENLRGGPDWLAVGLPESTGDTVGARFVRIRRQVLPGESGNATQLGDWRVLSVGEVQVFAKEATNLPHKDKEK